MPADPRIIVALDLPTSKQAAELVSKLGTYCSCYKIGLELIAAGDGIALATALINKGKDVFIDLKLLDIPATVARATSRISALGARLLTVHFQEDALKAAVGAAHATNILAVTVLTSVSQAELTQQGITSALTDLVVARSVRAVELGCAGVICSPQEASAVRAALGPDCLVVTPGIRLGASGDDQQRTATAHDALVAGADHVVIGRPIRDAADPLVALQELQATLP